MIDPLPFDSADPLVRIKGESARANNALRQYYLMGAGRSLRALLAQFNQQVLDNEGTKPPTTRFNTLGMWSSAYNWQARIAAQTEIDFEADRLAWESRRRQIKEDDWTQSVALRDLAAKIMAEGPNFIKTRRRVVKGQPTVVDAAGNVVTPGTADQIIVTMALDARTAIRAAGAGSKLARIAADMPTNKQTIDLGGSVRLEREVDFDDLDDSQIADRLAGSAKFLNEISGRIGGIEQPGNAEGTDDQTQGEGQIDS